MRTYPAAQTSFTYDPIWKVQLTSGTTSYEYDRTRVTDITHAETPDSGLAEIVLNNSDKVLASIDFTNYQATISYGVNATYSATAPLKVRMQAFNSGRGLLTCTLRAIGLPDQLKEDAASSEYTQTAANTTSAKAIANSIASTALAPYSAYAAMTITWDTASPYPDSNKPADYFKVKLNETRWDKLMELASNFDCQQRMEADGALHFIDAVVSGTAYDYEYKFNVSGSHGFFDKTTKYSFVIPNKEVVSSNPAEGSITASATSGVSYGLSPKVHTTYMRVASSAVASSIAVAKIKSNDLDAETGFATVPMNVGQEIWDYVKITDSRQDDTRVGNVRYIQRNVHVPRGGGTLIYNMNISYGKVPENAILAKLLNFGPEKLSSENILELFEAVEKGLDRLVKNINGSLAKIWALLDDHERRLKTVAIPYVIDGGGAVIATGEKGYISIPFACTIESWTLEADTPGAIVVDVWKDTYANFPPTDADAMPGAGKEPTIAATNQKAQDTDVTDWTTTSITAGDILAFNVDSCTTITRVTLVLNVRRQ